MKKDKDQNGRYVSLFTKSVAALILIGILPLVIMGISIYNAYLGSIKETILSNLYRTTLSVGKNMEDLFYEMEENTKYLYSYENEEYGYLYQILENREISESRKDALVTELLRNLLYRNQHIEHVFFVEKEGEIYSAMRPPENIVYEEKMRSWHELHFQETSRAMRLIPVHKGYYYRGSEKEVFSVSRNIMNTETIESAGTELLGTLYIDISAEYLYKLIHETRLEEDSQIYIVDKSREDFAYDPYEGKGISLEEMKECLKYMDTRYQYVRVGGDYFIYSLAPKTDWLIVERIPEASLEESFQGIRGVTLAIIGFSVLLLIFIYYEYSKRTSRPIRELKEAMESIQKGALDTRVRISSRDEIGFLAKGLNSMTEKLQEHIRRVYIAEIRQREAKIEALKTQIQPHYLYNTLDVIRMKAITNDDQETAQMIDGLSGQLRYLVGGAADMVPLLAEADSVRNYFKIIQIRYENRISLDMELGEELLQLRVPQLILQPVVENAVKYGLKPKEGEGVVAVQGRIEGDFLELSVMDNGVGMEPERLEYVRNLLASRETEDHPKSRRASIGLKNVYDRIKLIFGEAYRIEISSLLGIGTIVKYRLPVIREENGEGRKEDV